MADAMLADAMLADAMLARIEDANGARALAPSSSSPTRGQCMGPTQAGSGKNVQRNCAPPRHPRRTA